MEETSLRCSLPPEGAWPDKPPSHWRAAPEMVTPSHLLEQGTPTLASNVPSPFSFTNYSPLGTSRQIFLYPTLFPHLQEQEQEQHLHIKTK